MSVGGAQGIAVDGESGVFQGGADPRRDGVAMGW
jgi:gamma-glutamyltranspeptidase